VSLIEAAYFTGIKIRLANVIPGALFSDGSSWLLIVHMSQEDPDLLSCTWITGNRIVEGKFGYRETIHPKWNVIMPDDC
jgi:hypothetical protein